MTENMGGKKSIVGGIVDDFRALSTKQTIGIILGIAAALLLEAFGMVSFACFGILLVAVVLYMIPHLMGLESVKIKAIVCVVFAVLSLILGTFAFSTPDNDAFESASEDGSIHDFKLVYDDGADNYTVSFIVEPGKAGIEGEWNVRFVEGEATAIGFGQVSLSPNTIPISSSDMTLVSDGVYSCSKVLENMNSGEIYYVGAILQKVTGTAESPEYEVVKKSVVAGYYDTGISSGDAHSLFFKGAAIVTAEIVLFFMIILLFSFFMRRSAMKSREKMEAEGRLYPQGYGRCKKCGAMVLPGEVTCRKCGEYIDVPEEIRAQKKDFFTCSECGAEVPSDATVCPKCGATFDEKEEVEVSHPDGTVDVTTETVACPHCGEQIPDNADWCPKCGKKVRD